MSSDGCLEGIRQFHDKRFKRKRGREQSDEDTGKAWTVVSPDLMRKWNGEAK